MILLEAQQYIVGGLIIGCGVGFLYLSVGMIVDVVASYATTMSLFFRGSFFRKKRFKEAQSVHFVHIIGLLAGGTVFTFFVSGVVLHTDVSFARMFFGGVLVGLGAAITGGSLLSHSAYTISELGRSTSFVSFAFLSIVCSVAYLTRIILVS